MFDQERLDVLLDEDFIFSADIVSKILLKNLKPGKHGLDDWLRSLPSEKLDSFIDYCHDCAFESLDYMNDKNIDIRDLISVTYVLIELETDEELEEELEGEEIADKMELLNFAANMEMLRRVGIINCVQKSFLSDSDSGVYEASNDEKKT